jgi:hypothetical protein
MQRSGKTVHRFVSTAHTRRRGATSFASTARGSSEAARAFRSATRV